MISASNNFSALPDQPLTSDFDLRPLNTLSRFHAAQASPTAGYDTALAEIRRGRKTSHWIWYIFPQLAGLGRSSIARTYAIRDLAEACDYLRDPLLRARYEEIAGAVSDQLARGVSLEELMGSRTDALKLVSSLTVFRAAAKRLIRGEPIFAYLVELFASLLGETTAHGYPPCTQTLARVNNTTGLGAEVPRFTE